LEKDPEAAKEKLKELEKDRAFERATLKHRGTGKWSTQLRKYASKNPGMQKLITEHLNLGRELKSKLGFEGAIDGEDEGSEEEIDKPLTKSEMIEVCFDYLNSFYNNILVGCGTSTT
jgi:U3 small nucleolar RNA-associated protein 14